MTVHKITVKLSDIEYRAWAAVVADPHEWVETLVRHDVARAMRNIYEREVARMTDDPNVEAIPANIEAVIALADLTPAKERDAQLVKRLTELPGNVAPPNDV